MNNNYCVNWNAVPMVFNESYTYLEMLGKTVSQIETLTPIVLTNQEFINGYRDEINRISDLVLSNNTRISNLEGTVNINSSDIENLKVTVDTHNTLINAINNNLTGHYNISVDNITREETLNITLKNFPETWTGAIIGFALTDVNIPNGDYNYKQYVSFYISPDPAFLAHYPINIVIPDGTLGTALVEYDGSLKRFKISFNVQGVSNPVYTSISNLNCVFIK